MSFTEREKAADKALRRLTTTLMRGLSPDIRHELYGRSMLTWTEKEKIGEQVTRTIQLVYRDTVHWYTSQYTG